MKINLLSLLLFLGLLNTACLPEHDDLVPDLEGVPAGGLKKVSVTSTEGNQAEIEIQLFVVDHLGGFIPDLKLEDFSITSSTSHDLDIVALEEIGEDEIGPFSASLLFDQSGSINTTDPLNARVEAGVKFAEIVKGGDEASVAAFSTNGFYNFPYEILQEFTSNTDDLQDQIRTLVGRADGGTPLYRSIHDLIPYTVDNSKNNNLAIVAFTDGEDTDGGVRVENLIQRAKDTGVGIYTVGLGTNVNQDVLSFIAFETDGAVMLAEDALQLISLYSSLGDLLRGEAKYYKLKVEAQRQQGNFFSGERIGGIVQLELSESSTINYPFRAFVF